MGVKIVKFFVAITFSIVGLFFFIAGIVSSIKMNSKYIQTTAEVKHVIKHTKYNTIIVSYNVNNQIYNSSCEASYSISEGNFITICYEKNNPNKISLQTNNNLPLVFGSFFGISFAGPGLGIIFYSLYKTLLKIRLLKNGEKIIADFQTIDINYTVGMGPRAIRQHPYFIICQYNDINGETRIFRSYNIWYNPEPIIRERNITKFPVYISIKNPKKYYVSLEEIERK